MCVPSFERSGLAGGLLAFNNLSGTSVLLMRLMMVVTSCRCCCLVVANLARRRFEFVDGGQRPSPRMSGLDSWVAKLVSPTFIPP